MKCKTTVAGILRAMQDVNDMVHEANRDRKECGHAGWVSLSVGKKKPHDRSVWVNVYPDGYYWISRTNREYHEYNNWFDYLVDCGGVDERIAQEIADLNGDASEKAEARIKEIGESILF